MGDALQLILNGLVQAIVQHPTFQESLRSILVDVQPVPEAIDEELSTQRCNIMTHRGDIDNLTSRIERLEILADRDDTIGYARLERRLDELENANLEEQLKECQIDGSNIVGLDAAIEAVVVRVKITLVVEPDE